MKTFSTILEKVETIAPAVKFFRFALDEDSRDFKFQPGQFLSAKISDKVFRAYSFCSHPRDLPRFELVIKIIPGGLGSTFFDNLKSGGKLEFFAPFGHFLLPEKKSDLIFIATGVGFAPFRSFLREIFHRENPPRVDLFFGFRHEEDSLFTDEISELQKKFPEKFVAKTCVSQPRGNNFTGNRGRVTDFLRTENLEFFTDKKVFLCGSKAMSTEVQKILHEKKVVPENISDESY